MKKVLSIAVFALFAYNLFSQDLVWINKGENTKITSPQLSPDRNYLLYKDSPIDFYPGIVVWDFSKNEVLTTIKDLNIGRLDRFTITADNEIVFWESNSDGTINQIVRYNFLTGEKETRDTQGKFSIYRIIEVEADKYIFSNNVGGKTVYTFYDFENNTFGNEVSGANMFNFFLLADKSELITNAVDENGTPTNAVQIYDSKTLEPIFTSEELFTEKPNIFLSHPGNGKTFAISSGGNYNAFTQELTPYFEMAVWDKNKELISYEKLDSKTGFSFYGLAENSFAEEIYLYDAVNNEIFTYDYEKKIFKDTLSDFPSHKLISMETGEKYLSDNYSLYKYRENYSKLNYKASVIAPEDGHISPVSSVVQLNQNTVISASDYGIVFKWDIETGEFGGRYIGFPTGVTDMEISNNKKYLAVGTSKFLTVLDVEENIMVLQKKSNSMVLSVNFSRDDKFLITTDRDDDVKIYSLDSMRLYKSLDAGRWVRSAEMIDENRIITTIDKSVQIFNFHTGEKLDSINLYEDGASGNTIRDIQLSPNGEMIAIASYDGIERIFDLEMNPLGKMDYKVIFGSNAFNGSVWSNNSNVLYFISGAEVLMWDIKNDALVHRFNDGFEFFENTTSILDISLSNDEKYIFVATDNVELAMFESNISSGIEHKLEYFEVYPNPSSDFIVISSNEKYNKIEIYNVSGELVFKTSSKLESIDISNLITGVYYLQIMSDGKIDYGKFFKK